MMKTVHPSCENNQGAQSILLLRLRTEIHVQDQPEELCFLTVPCCHLWLGKHLCLYFILYPFSPNGFEGSKPDDLGVAASEKEPLTSTHVASCLSGHYEFCTSELQDMPCLLSLYFLIVSCLLCTCAPLLPCPLSSEYFQSVGGRTKGRRGPCIA